MRSANIGTLKNQLSAYLQFVRNGEEVIIRDRNVPIARILPFCSLPGVAPEDAKLIAAGIVQPPQHSEPINWDSFLALPRPKLSGNAAAKAIDWAKGER
jgi:antitoxin (DNA-binding transcriptional repressor) of toxin-antitoxin stability system